MGLGLGLLNFLLVQTLFDYWMFPYTQTVGSLCLPLPSDIILYFELEVFLILPYIKGTKMPWFSATKKKVIGHSSAHCCLSSSLTCWGTPSECELSQRAYFLEPVSAEPLCYIPHFQGRVYVCVNKPHWRHLCSQLVLITECEVWLSSVPLEHSGKHPSSVGIALRA